MEGCVRGCVAQGVLAARRDPCEGLRAAGRAWRGVRTGLEVAGTGAAVPGACRGAGIHHPARPIPLSRPPRLRRGVGGCSPARAGAGARRLLQRGAAAGGGQHGRGDGPPRSAGPRRGSSAAGKGGALPASPPRQGPSRPRHPRGHCPSCVRAPGSSHPPPSPCSASWGDRGVLSRPRSPGAGGQRAGPMLLAPAAPPCSSQPHSLPRRGALPASPGRAGGTWVPESYLACGSRCRWWSRGRVPRRGRQRREGTPLPFLSAWDRQAAAMFSTCGCGERDGGISTATPRSSPQSLPPLPQILQPQR